MQINVWAEAKKFHEITPDDIKKDVEGFYEIVKNGSIYWESSINCLSREQAINEYEQDTQDYYFELVIEHNFQMQYASEELH